MVAPFNWGGGIPWDWNYSDSQNDYNDYKTTALAFMIAMTEKIISNPQPKRLNQHGNENKPKRQRTN